jgi:predicted Rossmann fold flavoprotein
MLLVYTEAMYDVIIIGGGAAGLYCAKLLGEKQLKVLVIEHNKKLGQKILISGGGRCNFTNLDVSASNFASNNKHFSKSALNGFSSHDFINWVKEKNISFYEKKFGQLFCTNSAKEMLSAIISDCEKGNIELLTSTTVINIEKNNETFEIITKANKKHETKNLVIATGGLSFPKIGASDFGHNTAKQFGHKITSLSPVLVGLQIPSLASLSGTSFYGKVSFKSKAIKQEFSDDILFTHKGLSGPAILQASLYWEPNETMIIDMCPDENILEYLMDLKKSDNNLSINKALGKFFNKAILTYWFEKLKVSPDIKLCDMKNKTIELIANSFNKYEVTPIKSLGYDRAEATKGGVSLDKVSSQTMQSKLVPGLYFIGEVLDVTGQLGGFNFQWAWSSAYAAAKSME